MKSSAPHWMLSVAPQTCGIYLRQQLLHRVGRLRVTAALERVAVCLPSQPPFERRERGQVPCLASPCPLPNACALLPRRA